MLYIDIDISKNTGFSVNAYNIRDEKNKTTLYFVILIMILNKYLTLT